MEDLWISVNIYIDWFDLCFSSSVFVSFCFNDEYYSLMCWPWLLILPQAPTQWNQTWCHQSPHRKFSQVFGEWQFLYFCLCSSLQSSLNHAIKSWLKCILSALTESCREQLQHYCMLTWNKLQIFYLFNLSQNDEGTGLTWTWNILSFVQLLLSLWKWHCFLNT